MQAKLRAAAGQAVADVLGRLHTAAQAAQAAHEAMLQHTELRQPADPPRMIMTDLCAETCWSLTACGVQAKPRAAAGQAVADVLGRLHTAAQAAQAAHEAMLQRTCPASWSFQIP